MSEVAYGFAAHGKRGVVTRPEQCRANLLPIVFTPLVDQQPREATPLGHFKAALCDDGGQFGVYQPFVRFHAGWPVLYDDTKALIISRFGTQVGEDGQVRLGLPLIVIKRHGTPLREDMIAGRPMRPTAGLMALVGDTGFAMNKNLEREDGQPIEGMRENAYFWRWFLDLLEHEEEKWRVPREELPQQPQQPSDPLLKMLPLWDIPPLKRESIPQRDDKAPAAVEKPAGEQIPADAKEPPKTREQDPGESKGPLLQKPDSGSAPSAKEKE